RYTTQGVIDYVHSDLWGPSHVESLGGKRYFLSIADDYSRRVWVYILRFKHEAFEKFKEWKQLVENQTERTVKKLRTDNAIEKKTPMEMWSGHPSDYGMLRTFSCVAYSYVKQVTSRNVVFNESVMYKDTLKDSGAGADKSVEELQTPDLTYYQLVRDREPRTRTKHLTFQDESNMAAYAFAVAEKEDTHEPLTYQEAVACEDNHPARKKLVSCKWLFKIKEGIECVQRPRYKARLVARGFTQRACIDYNEVFLLVVRRTSIRVILALIVCKDYELEQLDVKTTFLHRNLEEVIYMRQPPGYEHCNKVCLLKKSSYGLKQSPRQWYRRFDEYMLSNGFNCSSYDSCICYRSYAPGEYIYLFLYVDDMLIACKSKAEIGSIKTLLNREFYMKELEEAKKILGSSEVDLKYLRGTTNVGLVYGTNLGNHVDVTSFVDSDYAKDLDKGKSITGYAFLVQGCVVSWKATLQHVVALLTIKAEYIALTEVVNCDNQGAIYLSRNHVFHERTKYINVHYYFIREVLEGKTIEVLKVGTEHNVVDALTKVVPRHKLQHCLELLIVGSGRSIATAENFEAVDIFEEYSRR
nr:retrotransposon protein, putative, Ty1-copia subclass [Tanacetum cinerariifolium]